MYQLIPNFHYRCTAERRWPSSSTDWLFPFAVEASLSSCISSKRRRWCRERRQRKSSGKPPDIHTNRCSLLVSSKLRRLEKTPRRVGRRWPRLFRDYWLRRTCTIPRRRTSRFPTGVFRHYHHLAKKWLNDILVYQLQIIKSLNC